VERLEAIELACPLPDAVHHFSLNFMDDFQSPFRKGK
jgi:hypothetical protein